MISVFIDSSVLFSAAKSRFGASALLFAYSRKGKIQVFISDYVIIEVKRNILKEDQKTKQRLNILLLQSRLKPSIPNAETIKRFKGIIKDKDVPILAGAFSASVDYLITLDKEDFMNPKVKNSIMPIKIVTPRDFLVAEQFI